MASFQEIAQKKIAGVPVLYLAGAFVAILAIVAWKMKPSTPPEEPRGDESTTPGNVPTDEGDVDYSGLATNGTVTVVQGTPATAQDAAKQTNDDWEREAVNFIVDSGLASPGVAQTAIHKYLEGSDLSYEEGQLRDAAIKKLKLPPEPLYTVGVTGTEPARRQAGTLPGAHTVKGSNDNTAAKLATLYYGNGDAIHAATITAANTRYGPTGTTYPAGTRITIPQWYTPYNYTATKTINTATKIGAKNGLSAAQVQALNPSMKFPVSAGTKVRVK
jgi:hypothetical protein